MVRLKMKIKKNINNLQKRVKIMALVTTYCFHLLGQNGSVLLNTDTVTYNTKQLPLEDRVGNSFLERGTPINAAGKYQAINGTSQISLNNVIFGHGIRTINIGDNQLVKTSHSLSSESQIRDNPGLLNHSEFSTTGMVEKSLLRITASFSDNQNAPDYAVVYFDPKGTSEFMDNLMHLS